MSKEDLMKVDGEILEDINSINEMIETEKKIQAADTKKEEKVEVVKTERPKSSLSSIVDVTSKVVDEMERLHLRIVNDTIDILYRPSHEYISFVPNDENGKAEVKRIALMTRDEFKEYLKASNCFRFTTLSQQNQAQHSNAETWYKGAWSMSTKKIFDELGILNPIEEPIYI